MCDRTAVVVVPVWVTPSKWTKRGSWRSPIALWSTKAITKGLERLRRELKDACGGRPIVETVATEGRGTETLLETLFG